eukprot:1992974-Pleurochrysis_carterae.AAC.1
MNKSRTTRPRARRDCSISPSLSVARHARACVYVTRVRHRCVRVARTVVEVERLVVDGANAEALAVVRHRNVLYDGRLDRLA